MRSFTVALLAVVLAGGASCDKGLKVSGGGSRTAITVGAKTRFAVIDACEYAGPGLLIISPVVPLILPTPPTCLSTSVDEIVAVSFSDPEPFRLLQTNVDQGAALFEIEAVAEGETEVTIRIKATTGENYTVKSHFRASTAVRVDLVTDFCESSKRNDGLVAPGTIVRYLPRFFSSTGEALGGFGYLPFDFAGLTTAVEETWGGITVTFPDATGTHVFTSSADPEFAKEVRVIAPGDLTSLELVPGRDVFEMAQGDLAVAALARVGSEIPCFEDFPRRVYTDTPAACGLNRFSIPPPETTLPEITDARREWTYVRGLTYGAVCRVHAEVLGTTLTATLEMPVHEGWIQLPDPPAGQYLAGASTGPESIIVVGGEVGGTPEARTYTSLIAMFDGDAWQAERPATAAGAMGDGRLRDVFVAGDKTFVVGHYGTMLMRQAGGAFVAQNLPTTANLGGLFGVSATEVYAVGQAGTLIHWDGIAWSVMASGTTMDLADGWSFAPGVAWAAGSDSTLVGLADGVWAPIDISGLTQKIYFQSIWAGGPNDVYLAGFGGVVHFDGRGFSVVLDADYYYRSVWGTGVADVYVAGSHLSVDHFDGETWGSILLGSGYTFQVWSRGADEIYVLAAWNPGYHIFRYR